MQIIGKLKLTYNGWKIRRILSRIYWYQISTFTKFKFERSEKLHVNPSKQCEFVLKRSLWKYLNTGFIHGQDKV